MRDSQHNTIGAAVDRANWLCYYGFGVVIIPVGNKFMVYIKNWGEI
jgi:hypothetical protein